MSTIHSSGFEDMPTIQSTAPGAGDPRPIVVLVHHPVHADPRVLWSIRIAEEYGPVSVFGLSYSPESHSFTYDGRVSVRDLSISLYSTARERLSLAFASALLRFPSVKDYEDRRKKSVCNTTAKGDRFHDWYCSRLRRLGIDKSWAVSSDILRRHVESVCPHPKVVLAHDLLALHAGVALKRRFGCGLIYDAHENWPYEDVLNQDWESQELARREKKLVTECDEVITVSPMLADKMRSRYGLDSVHCVPNVAPAPDPPIVPPTRSNTGRLRFLIQGGACHGRGFETVLRAWRRMDATNAVLLLRCPPNPYLESLRRDFADLVDAGCVRFVPPVQEEELISAASESDVGLITYETVHENCRVACPNKLSQFMHAGLAILGSNLPFVQNVVTRYDCGVIFESGNQESFMRSVRTLLENPEEVLRMRQRAHLAAQQEFHWDAVKGPYTGAFERLVARGGCGSHPGAPSLRRPAA